MSATHFTRRALQTLVGVTVLILAAAWVWLTGGSLHVQAFRMASGAMSGTLLPGDFVFVDRAARPPRRQAVAVITCGAGDGWCVYRIIGVAGDTVAVRGHRAYVNGERLDEPYTETAPIPATDSVANRSAVIVPPGHVFVLGDNRAESYDSRYWGFLRIDRVHGRPVGIYWSWDAEAGRVRWGRIGRRIR
jgi:signal peptidase I